MATNYLDTLPIEILDLIKSKIPIDFEKELNNLGMDKLIDILRIQFKMKCSNMKTSKIPLQTRKNHIISLIINQTKNNKNIINKIFPKKENENKIMTWVDNFIIGEDIIQCDGDGYKKAIVKKINAKSITISFYNFDRIITLDDDGYFKSQKVIWKEISKINKVIYSSKYIHKKGYNDWYDKLLIEGN